MAQITKDMTFGELLSKYYMEEMLTFYIILHM